jgi:hypothetical protein
VLRRLLLALVTGLIVARPLVLGEDPGLLNRLSNAWSLLLSLLWFVAAFGWAVWRAWSGQTTWRGSTVEAGLLAVAALVWSSAAGAAHYKHPALLIASEWLVLLAAFCLVRQLARTPEDDRGLLAAILASGVSISAFALYQYTVEFPEIRRAYGGNLDTLLDAMAAQNVVANPRILQQRLFENNVFATYSHPNSLASYLALLFPIAIAWTLMAKPCRAQSAESGALPGVWRFALRAPRFTSFYLAASATLLIGLALWLTHSRGAILATVLVGLAVLAAYCRRFLAAHKAAFLTGLTLLLLLAVGICRTESAANGIAKFWESSAKRNDYWKATWGMIRDHPWLGVGPGYFGLIYPSYMLPRAFEQVKDPHNFILEMWATAGVFALIALLITLGILFRRTWPVFRSPWPVSVGEPQVTTDSGPWTRWEFYLGGMVGLILGFVLRALDQSPDEILMEGTFSACRSIIWFAAFALFYSIPWSGGSRPLALTTGVAALLLNLLVSGGIAMPSVAQPLWVMAALALNSIDPAPPSAGRFTSWLPRMVPLSLLGGIGLAYFLMLFYPAVSCGRALSEARRHYPVWHGEVLPGWRNLTGEEAQKRMSGAAARFLETTILEPLKRAVEADPGNATAWLELAEWYGEQFKVSPVPEVTIGNAIRCAHQAQLLDPDNKESYIFKYNLHVLIAQRFGQREKEEYGNAATAMRAAVERDPTNARLRYQLAETLFLADLPVEGRRHAATARSLDEQATKPERELTSTQRDQIRKWLAAEE